MMQVFARSWPTWTAHAVVLFGLWLVLAGSDPAAWLIGIPAVTLATWASVRLGCYETLHISLPGMLRFIAFFARESLRGGLDVAARTLSLRLRVAPGYTTYPVRLPAGRARRLFVSCIGLLPGTLVAEDQGDQLMIHLLDTNVPAGPELKRLEDAVSGAFPLPREIPDV